MIKIQDVRPAGSTKVNKKKSTENNDFTVFIETDDVKSVANIPSTQSINSLMPFNLSYSFQIEEKAIDFADDSLQILKEYQEKLAFNNIDHTKLKEISEKIADIDTDAIENEELKNLAKEINIRVQVEIAKKSF